MSDLNAAEQFLKNKGIDTEKYVIRDTNGGYMPQIQIALWLTEFAEQQANGVNTSERQLTIPDVSNQRELLLAYSKWITTTGAYPDIYSEAENVDEYLSK